MPAQHKPTLGYQLSPSDRLQGQLNATAYQSKPSPEQTHYSPLDYVRAPGAHRVTPSYQSPYSPPNIAQTTNIRQQTPIPTANVPGVPKPTYSVPHGPSYPLGGASWNQNSIYRGPSFSSFSGPEPTDSAFNGAWNTKLTEPTLPEPVSPKMSSEEVPGLKEGSHDVQEPMTPEQAILSHIAPWNSRHPPQNATEPGPGLLTAEHPPTQSELNLERLRSLPRSESYHEYTGGTLPHRHPRETGICPNMDFKTKTFIDAHGATFTGSRSGPYRYMKPENRFQELAIIQATYQTIADFELYIGSSPRQKVQTWQSYDFQYRQLQLELMDRWVGPPETMPKLR